MLKIVEGYCSGFPNPGLVHQNSQSSNWYLKQLNHGSTTSIGGIQSPVGSNSGGPVRRAASYPDEVITAARPPQLIVAEDEKIFVEEMEDGHLVIKERSLVDTVYSLKDQVTLLQKARRI